MRERDRLSIKAHRQEIEAEEREAEEKRLAPIRAMESKLKSTHYELAKVYIARLRGEVADPERFISTEVEMVKMTAKQADDYTTAQWKVFSSGHPEIYWGGNGELIDNLAKYFERNGIKIITAEMFARLVERFAEYNLLPARPAPEPVPEPTPEPTPEPVEQPSTKTYVGRDWQTGLDREFTEREVNRMSSTDFARSFKVAGTFTELFNAMRREN